MSLKYILAMLVLALTLPLGAQDSVIQESHQRFHPRVAEHAMVATQSRPATRIGVDILEQGGNAVDAAVAVGFALAVSLPRAGNIGGGGFMLVWQAEQQQAHAINYRENAPLKASKQMYQDEDGEIIPGKSSKGYQASGVPGTVAGLLLAHRQYGSLPLKQVMRPAIRLAENGVVVSPSLSQALENSRERLAGDKEARNIFFHENGGQVWQPGERLKRPDLAHTLKLIAARGRKGFYAGETADRIVSAMQAHNGLITHQDLKQYQAGIMQPVTGEYRGYKLYSMPPPSGGGVTLIEMLNILEGYPMSEYGLNDARYVHLLTEAASYAYNDRNFKLGDPDFIDNPVKKLTSTAYARKIREKIDKHRHTPSKKISRPVARPKESRQTTHFSIIDQQGNMVSNTYTLNYSFGNAHVIKDTGIVMNNEMDDFTAKAGVPNAYGLIQGKANAIAPQKQPLSSMTPTIIVTEEDKPFLATGSPGGSRIITTTMQVILNVIDHGLNIQGAVSAPRMHNQLWPDEIQLEQGFSRDTVQLLEQMGHKVVRSRAMGSAQTVQQGDDQVFGAADPRRAGASARGL